MSHELVGINAAVELGQSEGGLTISFTCGGTSPGVGVLTIPRSPTNSPPFDLTLSEAVVVALPSTVVGSVSFPGPAGSPPIDIPMLGAGVGLIEMPQGGHLAIGFPAGGRARKIKVTLKAGAGARFFTQAAAM